MKKLMIAAAAAAMIGGVQAATATYDFDAWLDTTANDQSEAWSTEWYEYQEPFKLGRNDDGEIWYESTLTDNRIGGQNQSIINLTYNQATGLYSASWRTWRTWGGQQSAAQWYGVNLEWVNPTSKDDEHPFPVLRVKESAKNADGYWTLTPDEEWFLRTLDGLYGNPSMGEWCAIIEWYTYNADGAPSRCYRVVGYDEIHQKVTLNTATCCGDVRKFTSAKGEIDFSKLTDEREPVPTGFLLNRFGQPLPGDAMDVELYASANGFKPTDADGTFNGYIAGQGNAERVIPENGTEADVFTLPREINGKIVGSLAARLCKDCCTPVARLPRAIAFDCLTSGEPNGDLLTAAFGNFSLTLQEFVKDE